MRCQTLDVLRQWIYLAASRWPCVIKAEINLFIDEMSTPHGSFAEYAIAWAYATFHLSKKTIFEEV
jgi:hypothetical protein